MQLYLNGSVVGVLGKEVNVSEGKTKITKEKRRLRRPRVVWAEPIRTINKKAGGAVDEPTSCFFFFLGYTESV